MILIFLLMFPPASLPSLWILFSVKNMGTAKAYVFRVYAHSATAYTPSDPFRWEKHFFPRCQQLVLMVDFLRRYAMPENVKRRAITAGLIGGVLFFIVAIIVSVCTVKICNRRKRRKQEQGERKPAKLNTISLSNFLPQIIFQPCYFSISLKALKVQYIFPGRELTNKKAILRVRKIKD